MAETQSIITAIRDSEAEGFVTSTLFSQGWDINFRSLDFDSLISYVKTIDCLASQVLISTDCEGLTCEGLEQLRPYVQKIFLFQTSSHPEISFGDSIVLPTTPLELIALIRGSLRAPLIRSQHVVARSRQARVIAVAAASGGAGCTTLSFNLAAEFILLGKRTLLVDADSIAPSLAALLSQRGLTVAGTIKSITPTLSAIELTQDNIAHSISSLDAALSEFEVIIIDLGRISEVAQQLSGRRWSGQALTWVSNFADSLLILSPSNRIGLERLKVLVAQLTRNAMKPRISFLHVLREPGRREQAASDKFLQTVSALSPVKIYEIPFDIRAALKAEHAEESLVDSNERSVLRKVIAELAGVLAS